MKNMKARPATKQVRPVATAEELCSKELQALLAKYDCDLDAVMLIRSSAPNEVRFIVKKKVSPL